MTVKSTTTKNQNLINTKNKRFDIYENSKNNDQYEENLNIFQSLMQNEEKPSRVVPGQVYESTIQNQNEDSMTVRIGNKYEIILPNNQIPNHEKYNVGDSINVYVESVKNDIKVNLKIAADILVWQHLEKALEEKKILLCYAYQPIHCGYTVKIPKQLKIASQEEAMNNLNDPVNIKDEEANKENNDIKSQFEENIKQINQNPDDYVNAFLPNSQSINPASEGMPLFVQIINVKNSPKNRNKKSVIVSTKEVIFNIKKIQQEQLFVLAEEALSRKDIIIANVIITNVIDFGIFAKVMGVVIKDKNNNTLADIENLKGCVDGLVHVTEMSWKKDSIPHTIKYAKNDRLNVRIISVDKKKKRVHFSIKHMGENPWEGEINYKIGQVYKNCRITDISNENILLNIPELAVEGVVENNEISWSQEDGSKNKSFITGMEVSAMIIKVDVEKQKLFFSIKKAEGKNPLSAIKQKYEKLDNIVECKIKKHTYNHLIVELEDNITARIPKEYLDWDINNRNLSKYTLEDNIKCKIIKFDEFTEEIILGIKQLTNDPNKDKYSSLKINDKIEVIVYDIEYSTVMVKLTNGLNGRIHRTELSQVKTEQKTDNFNVNDKLNVYVKSINEDLGVIELTSIDPNEETESKDKELKEKK